jgi:hypothetical protein
MTRAPWLVGLVAAAGCGGVSSFGCSSFIDRQAASSTYRILVASMQAGRREPDLELAAAAIPSGVIQLEAFALAYPDHAGFRTLHTESICQYGTGFVFDDWEDATLAGRTADATRIAARLGPLLDRCTEANLAALPTLWQQAYRRGPEPIVALLGSATRAQVPALLWLATADAVRIALAPMRQVARLPAVEAMLARCAELAPGFHDADAEILLGTLEAARARLFGGPDGAARFELARRLAGDGALIVEVMFARGTAIARKDRALFTATLERVISADPARWPERRLSNELARRKARRYLAAADTLL